MCILWIVQIEAIRELSTANSKWEEANKNMASDLEDAQEKANGLRLSLESAYREMTELKRTLVEQEDAAKEVQIQKEIEAREKVERQSREDLVRSISTWNLHSLLQWLDVVHP